MWPMLANEEHSTVSPMAKKDIMPKIVQSVKEKEGRELEPTSSTSMQKKIQCTKEAKPKEAEWP
jgi:hypothetical protein